MQNEVEQTQEEILNDTNEYVTWLERLNSMTQEQKEISEILYNEAKRKPCCFSIGMNLSLENKFTKKKKF